MIRRALVGLILATFGNAPASEAQIRRPLPDPPRPRIATGGSVLRNLHGSYGLSWMGPRINGLPEETYNVFLNDISSVQLFHSFQLGYQVSDALQLGLGGDASQNIADGVTGLGGTVYRRSFVWYDPYVFFHFPRLLRVPGWSVWSGASFSLPVVPASVEAARVTSLTFRQSWIKEFIAPWRLSFQLFLNPQIYNDPIPYGYADRQTFYAAFGPGVGLELTRSLALALQSQFTVEHRSPTSRSWTTLGESIPDTLKTSLTWSPDLRPLYASLGTYLQSVMWSPSFDTSIVGANFSLGF